MTTASSKATIRREYADYNQEISYFGRRDQYFTVRTLQKNGTLYRLDTYTVLPKTLANGFQLDSLSRLVRYGPTKIMYPTGQVYLTCDYKDGLLTGPFMVFYTDGAIKRRDYYRHGHLKKSQCYTPDGSVRACEPFYQPAQFTGSANDLSTYLKQKFEAVVDGFRVRTITATLTINEIGQIIDVKSVVNAGLGVEPQPATISGYVQRTMRNLPEWTPNQLNWKPALNDGRPIPSVCTLLIYRYRGSIRYTLTYRL
ncbi:hypothetical protein GCM10027577_29500 [Spirosoma fluminis]